MPTSVLTPCSAVDRSVVDRSVEGDAGLTEDRAQTLDGREHLPFSQLAVVAGVARSGTSWVGQILDSSPAVAYRFQPFFSYAFQGRVECDSTVDEWRTLLRDLYVTTDPFVLQAERRASQEYPTFAKEANPSCLALKTCRYQYLLSPLLKHIAMTQIVALVRHPCAVVNSWLNTRSEFPEGSDVRKEWRFGGCKNQGKPSEFFGYYKWKEVAHLYLDLKDRFPGRVHVLKYASLVAHPAEETAKLFTFLNLPLQQATLDFVSQCHSSHHTSPFAVFKDPSVKDKWQRELPSYIAQEIESDLVGTRLEEFLQ